MNEFNRYGEMCGEGDILKEIKSRLEHCQLDVDKNFLDQHLLVSKQAIEKMIFAANLTKQDRVLEIGPGACQITEAIAKEAGQVFAIELDKRFKPVLDFVSRVYGNVTPIYGSALKKKWPLVDKIVMNPPFSILEPLLERLIMEEIKAVCMVIGEEYYKRCNNIERYGSRTAFLTKVFFEFKKVSDLEKDDFHPRSRKKAVIMFLERGGRKKSNRKLRFIAKYIMENPNNTIRDALQSFLYLSDKRRGKFLTSRINDYGLSEKLLKKRINDLSNQDFGVLYKTVR